MSGWTDNDWTGAHRLALPAAPVHTAPAGSYEPPRKPRPPRWLLGALAAGVAITLAIVLATADWGPFASGQGHRRAACDGPQMTVAVVPDAYDALSEMVKDAGCTQIKVQRATPTDVLPSVVTSTHQPDVWIPDSSLWLQRAVPAQVRPATLKASMATSPVVLVSADGVPRRSFSQALGESDFLIGDPQRSMSALVTMAQSQRKKRTEERMRYHEQQVILGKESATELDAGRIADLRNTGLGSTAASEQEWATYAPDLAASAPADGTATLDFPVLVTASPDRRTKIARTITAFSRLLDSRSGQQALTRAGFRTELGGDPKPSVGRFRTVNGSEVSAAADEWDAGVEPTRAIVVGDVSESMPEAAGADTRLGFMQHAINDELGRLPANASIALWAFSDKHNGKLGEDYAEEVPMRRLDQLLYPDHQRDLLDEGVDGLSKLTGGGSSIYTSAVAAYKAALADYDPMASNSVVLLTDGSDDDAGRLQQTVHELEKLKDPRRPLPILAIGMTPDADMPSLTALAEVTGGAAYAAPDPATTSAVLHQAMIDRKRTMQ